MTHRLGKRHQTKTPRLVHLPNFIGKKNTKPEKGGCCKSHYVSTWHLGGVFLLTPVKKQAMALGGKKVMSGPD